MSTLSKVFVVLLLLISLVYLGISATLFAQRIDWKEKYALELKRHADSIKQRDLVISKQKAQIDTMTATERELQVMIGRLELEKKALQSQLTRVSTDLDDLKTQYSMLVARQGDLADQLKAEVTRNEKLRAELADAKRDAEESRAQRDMSLAEMQGHKRELELARKDLDELERTAVELAKEKDKQQYVLESLVRAGIPVPEIATQEIPALRGKVQGVSDQFNVCLISIGADDGVKVGFTFTIYRADKYVARGVVESVNPDWSVLRWDPALAKEQVMMGDDVTTSVTVGAVGDARERRKGK